MRGTVFNIQRFSVDDGPGVRTVVFLKGCPLRCRWCHNPEGLSARPQIMFNAERCIACGDCAEVCPNQSHLMEGQSHRFDVTVCVGCGKCADLCCSQALTLSGREMSADEVLAQVARDLPYYRESGGGMTLSGGEPLAQSAFALALLQQAKEAGIHTCVETSGWGDPAALREIARFTDRFLFDYKATGEEMHQRLCGVPQERILQNLALIDALGVDTVLRCPIVPDLNDTDDHLEGIARVAARHACIIEVQLEPYHRLGLSKAAQLGMDPTYEGQPPEATAMENYRQRIAALAGKPVSIS